MAVGVYGTNKPATLNRGNDVDIFYHYRPNRNTIDTELARRRYCPMRNNA
jgi:hypothetical protein